MAMPRGGGRGDGALLLRVDPLDVLFSYGRVAPAFSGCGRTLQATLESLLAGELAPDDLPHIAVVPIPPELWTRVGKSHAGGAARNDGGADGGDEDDEGRGRTKRATRKAKGKDNDKAEAGMRYVSLNNRRLYVLRECRRRGVLTTIAVRVKPPDECARLLTKGSRTFRLDRCCAEAVVLQGTGDASNGEPEPSAVSVEPM